MSRIDALMRVLLSLVIVACVVVYVDNSVWMGKDGQVGGIEAIITSLTDWFTMPHYDVAICFPCSGR